MLLPDGTNVNHTLVKDGWCWWYRTYAPLNAELEKLEHEAREAKKGLWVARLRCRRGGGEREAVEVANGGVAHFHKADLAM